MLRHKIATIYFNPLQNPGCTFSFFQNFNSSLFEMEKVLKQVGQSLQKWSVSSSIICRCKAEYFLVLVPPTSSIQGLPDLKFRK